MEIMNENTEKTLPEMLRDARPDEILMTFGQMSDENQKNNGHELIPDR